MKLLAELTEAKVGLSPESERLDSDYRLRKSARAIVLNERGEMAVQYLKNYTYHKLPGGGVEPGESVEQALKREVLEEVGCDCQIVREVGMTIEYRNQEKLLQISYCFAVKLVGEVGVTALEENEVEEGQETLWLKPEEVLTKLSEDKPGKYEGFFNVEREKAFITEFLGS